MKHETLKKRLLKRNASGAVIVLSERTGLVGHETAVGLHGDLCLALLQFQGTDGDAGDGALLVDLVTELRVTSKSSRSRVSVRGSFRAFRPATYHWSP